MRTLISFVLLLALLVLPGSQTLTHGQRAQQPNRDENGSISSVQASTTDRGVRIKWHTSYELNVIGFNIYRIENGQPVQINKRLIPASLFISGEGVPLRGGFSYSFLDRSGNTSSRYQIESIRTDGVKKVFSNVAPDRSVKTVEEPAVTTDSVDSGTGGDLIKQFPTAVEQSVPHSTENNIQTQYFIAAQSALKISINKDGWYRVTQAQMAAAGFNPSVEIRNLSLYGDGQEIAIATNKSSGQLSPGDFIEFYGQGLDTPTTNTRVYYLIANTQLGKRVGGDLQLDSAPDPISVKSPSLSTDHASLFAYRYFALIVNLIDGDASPAQENDSPGITPTAVTRSLNHSFTEKTLAQGLMEVTVPTITSEKSREATLTPIESPAPANQEVTPAATKATHMGGSTRKTRHRVKRRSSGKRKTKFFRHHPDTSAASAGNFLTTLQLKSRIFYIPNVINGPEENYFGDVICTCGPQFQTLVKTLTVAHPDATSTVPAQLEVALQGISFVTHQINVLINDVLIGSVNFVANSHAANTFNISPSQLLDGDNTVKLVQVLVPGVTSDTVDLDYLKLTYPHTYSADSNSLRFTLHSNQTAVLNNFSTPNLRLLDISDPANVKLTRPAVGQSGGSYALTVPAGPRMKSGRAMYALPESQFDTPAGFALNQPSTLNAVTNQADLIIVSHKSFIPSLAPLIAQRQSQGLVVMVADVEDVYDEFNFGAHGPQAIKNFVAQALNNWTTTPKPRYLLLVGNGSHDPRDYEGYASQGYGDFVPSQLVDTAFGETCSDDAMGDLNDDGIPEIGIGRLAVRTVAEADSAVSKIFNYSIANAPKTALLVADTQGSYYFNFEAADDEVQTLLPGSMSVQKVYRRLQSDDTTARTNIVNNFNQGLSLVNYSGHGNIDVWTGGGIFRTQDALVLNNGNHLPFVVVMDCLNGRFDWPAVEALAPALVKSQNGGAVASFASSGLTIPDGQHEMTKRLYQLIYGAQPVSLGDAIREAKSATLDVDVRRTWILIGDPSIRVW